MIVQVLRRFENKAAAIALNLNDEKSKCMELGTIKKRGNKAKLILEEDRESKRVEIEKVNSFIYLEFVLSEKYGTEEEIKYRITRK